MERFQTSGLSCTSFACVGTTDLGLLSPLASVTTKPAPVPGDHKAILHAVASYYAITVADLVGECRMRRFARPRQIAMYLLRENAEYSFPHIGHLLGGRDHATVMYGCGVIRQRLEHETVLRHDIEQIRHLL